MAIKTRVQASKVYSDLAKADYKKASSFKGMAKETVKGMPKAAVTVAKAVVRTAGKINDRAVKSLEDKNKAYYRKATPAQSRIISSRKSK